MRIIHISDLHLCTSFKRSNIQKLKLLIKHISELDADHLVITGDISDNAREKDYLILRKILQAFNLFSSDKTTIIPGNHDIFGGVQTAQDVLNFTSKCTKIDYKKKVEVFMRHFAELYETAFYPGEDFFPFAKKIDNVLLVGLNTVDKYSKLRNPFASNGLVNKKQIESLKGILSEKTFQKQSKVILSHHHFYRNCDEAISPESKIWNKIEKFTMKLRGKKELLKIFKKADVKLVLHGHSHDFKSYERKGIHFLNAGGSLENGNNTKYKMFVIDILGDDILIEKITAGKEEKPNKTMPSFQPEPAACLQ